MATGAESLQLFNQLVALGNSLFLSDQDFVTINGVTKPTLKKIYAEFLASIGTYTTVAAGLAATSGTGTNNRFFSVPGSGGVFETRYRNDAGVAVEISSLLSWLTDSRTINKGKPYPLTQVNRGGVTSPVSSQFSNIVLDCKVLGDAASMAGKYYTIGYFQNDANIGGDADQGVILIEFDAATIATTGAVGTIIHNHTDAPAKIIRENGVQFFEVIPALRPGMRFIFSIDSTAFPPAGTSVTAMSSASDGYSWIIDPSCYLPTQDYFERIPSIIPNGNFRNLGDGNSYYPGATYSAPIKPFSETYLNGLGCFNGFELSVEDTINIGRYLTVDVSAVGFDDTMQMFASLLVYSADGVFDFGAGGGPKLFKTLSSGGGSSANLVLFNQINANVRQYYISYEGVAPVDPTYTKEIRLGLQTDLPRTRRYVVTGLWLSVAPKDARPNGVIVQRDTKYPSWASGPASSVGASKAMDDIVALKAAGSATNQALSEETLARQLAVSELDQKIENEKVDRGTAINAEKTAREEADASISTALDTETASRIAGEQALEDALAVEEQARQAADSSLGDRIIHLEGLEGIFPDIDSGLAATKPSGTVSRTFRVPSSDEVYETRYRNVGGVATLLSRVLRQPGKLGTLVPNGNFRNLGAGNSYIGDRRPDSNLQSPVKAITDPTMVSLGCSAGFELAATDTFTAGAMIEVDVSAIGHERTMQVFASLMVFSADGTFDFGSGSGDGPVFYRELSDGIIQGSKMTSFTQLSDKVRRYTLDHPGSVPAETISIKYMRLGLVTPLPRAKTFQVSGIWISAAPAASVASGNIVLGDTSWPNWASGPASAIGSTKALDERISLEARVRKLESPPDKALLAMAKALRNPMHSVVVGLAGDSITNGVGSVYVAGANPIPEYDVNNPRINFAMKSWANQYRRNIGETYSESVVMIDGVPKDAVVQDGAGGGYYDKLHLVDPLDGNPNFKWIDTRSGRYIPAPTPTVAAGAMFGKWLDLSAIYRPEFDLVGNNLTIVNAQFVSADPSKVKMEVWDVLSNTKLGEFTWAGSSVIFGKESSITFPWGRYRVQIRDASTGSEFRMRLEGFKVTQRIEIINYGVSGSGTMSWLPGSANLNQVASRVEFVKFMLGTNDRGNTSQGPMNSSKTKANTKTIVNYLIGQGKKVIVMCSSVAINNAEKPVNPVYLYGMNDVMRALREASNELGVDFIDNYTPTRKAVVDGEIIFSGTDYLHPNNAGHKIMYDNIIRHVYGAQP